MKVVDNGVDNGVQLQHQQLNNRTKTTFNQLVDIRGSMKGVASRAASTTTSLFIEESPSCSVKLAYDKEITKLIGLSDGSFVSVGYDAERWEESNNSSGQSDNNKTFQVVGKQRFYNVPEIKKALPSELFTLCFGSDS